MIKVTSYFWHLLQLVHSCVKNEQLCDVFVVKLFTSVDSL